MENVNINRNHSLLALSFSPLLSFSFQLFSLGPSPIWLWSPWILLSAFLELSHAANILVSSNLFQLGCCIHWVRRSPEIPIRKTLRLCHPRTDGFGKNFYIHSLFFKVLKVLSSDVSINQLAGKWFIPIIYLITHKSRLRKFIEI